MLQLMVEIKINAVSGFVIKIDMCLDGWVRGPRGVGGYHVHNQLSKRMDMDFTLDILLRSKPNIQRMKSCC